MDDPSLDSLVYGELRRIAERMMARQPPGHTLQPTALVHEAWLRLGPRDDAPWTDRAHFRAVAARCMRYVLVDHARGRGRAKRGGGRARVTFTEHLSPEQPDAVEILVLHDAIEKLAAVDERAARVVEMRLFGDMSVREIAHALEVSPRTVDGDWASARLWLSREMRRG